MTKLEVKTDDKGSIRKTEIKRTDKEILEKWHDAMWSRYGMAHLFWDDETRIRMDEREKVLEWLFGERDILYSVKQWMGIDEIRPGWKFIHHPRNFEKK